MREGSLHWGSYEVGSIDDSRSTVRSLIAAELTDTRTFINLLYSEFINSGRRIQAERLLERSDGLPWFRTSSDKESK